MQNLKSASRSNWAAVCSIHPMSNSSRCQLSRRIKLTSVNNRTCSLRREVRQSRRYCRKISAGSIVSRVVNSRFAQLFTTWLCSGPAAIASCTKLVYTESLFVSSSLFLSISIFIYLFIYLSFSIYLSICLCLSLYRNKIKIFFCASQKRKLSSLTV